MKEIIRARVAASGMSPKPAARLSAMWRKLLVAGMATVTAG
jgi:hypothetical protein